MSDDKKKELIRSLKFTLFSISAGVIQIGTFTLLELFTPLPYWPCYLISLVLSVAYNFTINRKFTFQSAANIPIAMLKVFGYYVVFTPLTTIGGSFLVDVLGWNDFIVEILSMILNFLTEFLFTRFIVYGKSVDNSAGYIEKHGEEAKEAKEGPTISRVAITICAIAALFSVALIVVILRFGYTAERLLPGSWTTYYNDSVYTYVIHDDGTALLTDDNGNEAEYTYTLDGDILVMSHIGTNTTYVWNSRAAGFVADHEYGEINSIYANTYGDYENFSGFVYVSGDFLYFGNYTYCKTEKLEGYDESGLADRWIGAQGDTVTMTVNGKYTYKNYGATYKGTYAVGDDGSLTLALDDTPTVLDKDGWDLSGRVLRIDDLYYFREDQ